MTEAMSTKDFCRMILQKRGRRGMRAVAKEIGISFATLSRLERGRPPRVDTLKKVCTWLRIDPGRYLGTTGPSPAAARPRVQLAVRKGRVLEPKTTRELGRLITAAYREFAASVAAQGHQ
ncbi:MAG: helix-turn-helix domain-containing protein [Stellaceae bacterium]